MKYYKRAVEAFDYPMPPRAFGAFCKDCDEEILGGDPMFYEPDGDYDADGRARDCSTYLCKVCGVARGEKVPE